MGIEIERKFLIDFSVFEKGDFTNSFNIKQGYMFNSKEKVVRVRVQADKCYLTIKGKNKGASRPEFEYEIPRNDAEQMLNTMCINVIEKTRHIFHIFGDIWEIDEFHGDNEGLIVAEVEIPSEDYKLQIPKWVTKEVTEEVKYYNNNIAINAYKDWK